MTTAQAASAPQHLAASLDLFDDLVRIRQAVEVEALRIRVLESLLDALGMTADRSRRRSKGQRGGRGYRRRGSREVHPQGNDEDTVAA